MSEEVSLDGSDSFQIIKNLDKELAELRVELTKAMQRQKWQTDPVVSRLNREILRKESEKKYAEWCANQPEVRIWKEQVAITRLRP